MLAESGIRGRELDEVGVGAGPLADSGNGRVFDGRSGVGTRVGPSDSEEEAAGFSAVASESEIFSGLNGGVGEREGTSANFATRAARTRIKSFSAAVSKFGMLETVVDAAAVFSVVGTVACVSPDKSRSIGAKAVATSQAARFG